MFTTPGDPWRDAWTQRRWVAVVVVGVFTCCACFCALGVIAASENGLPAPTPPVFLPTATYAPTPSPSPLLSSPRAYVGGPYASFVTLYGLPFRQGGGNSVDFYIESTHSVVANVSPASGIVTHVGVQGPASWANQEIFNYCSRFLPADATGFKVTGSVTYFHSHVGLVAIDLVGAGTCLTLDYGAQ